MGQLGKGATDAPCVICMSSGEEKGEDNDPPFCMTILPSCGSNSLPTSAMSPQVISEKIYSQTMQMGLAQIKRVRGEANQVLTCMAMMPCCSFSLPTSAISCRIISPCRPSSSLSSPSDSLHSASGT